MLELRNELAALQQDQVDQKVVRPHLADKDEESYASSLVVEDLCKMAFLTKKIDKKLSSLGLKDDDPASSSGDDDEDSEDKDSEALKKQRGKHAKRVKSRKTAKINSRIRHPEIWPHSELSLSYVTKNISHNELTIEEFTAGCCAILNSSSISVPEKGARIVHLCELMYLAIQHEWSTVREFHAAVLLEIERGHLQWGDSFAHLERHSLHAKSRSGVVQCPSSMPVVLFCRVFQRNRCKLTEDHYGTIRGERKWLQHVCAKCWVTSRQIARHTEFLPDCPLLSGSPHPKETPTSTS